MARHPKHEEHTNHERWVISFADMMTLLFALFVVLYALNLAKIRDEVAQSIRWALHLEGDGKTQEEGIHPRGREGGIIIEAAPLVNAQKGPMKEFLQETLPREFEEITGQSLEVVMTDDTISFKGALTGFFQKGKKELLPEIAKWLPRLVEGSYRFGTHVRIHIDSPEATIGTLANNTSKKSISLGLERLHTVHTIVSMRNEIASHNVTVEFKYTGGLPPLDKAWEELGTITFAFSNVAPPK